MLYKAAEQSTAAARHLRSDCQHIRDLWTDLRTASTGLVVRCAYCQRIRAHDGDWFGVGALVDHILQRVDVLVVSHGICADCAALYFPANGAASPAPAKLALGHAPGP
ncbi:MAG TPA: hypothetical protein VFS33_01640 [Gemmatimonadales bacterium]|nr:hypothetical protein [Gemmatimonadales bacterium]